MSTTNFSPEIDDNTLYHKGDIEASTAQLIDDALAAANAALPKAAQLAVSDMDELRTTGFFHGYGTLNAPESGFMYFLVIAYPDGYNYWVKQLAFSFTDSKTYIRTMANGIWSTWEPIQTGTRLEDKVGDLAGLGTVDKTNAVAAINELVAALDVVRNEVAIAGALAAAAAPANHNHDGVYAPATHSHPQYLTSVPQYNSNTGESIYVCGPNRNHKTLQALVDSLPKFSIGPRRLQVDAGDYAEKVVLRGFHGGPITIETSGAYSGRANFLGILMEDCTATINVSNVNVGPAGGQNPSHGIYPTRCGVIRVENCNIQTVAFGAYLVRTNKLVMRNVTVSHIGGNLTAAVGMNESEGTFVALDGLTVNGGYGATAIQAQNAVVVGKRPVMNSVDVEINSNAGGVYYNVI